MFLTALIFLAQASELGIGGKIGLAIAIVIAIAAVYPAAQWLKKQKIIQKYHLEASIDKYADRLHLYLEDYQKEKTISGAEALKMGIDKVKNKFGVGGTDAEEAMRAAYTKGKRVKDAVEKAMSNANFPEPPGGDS